MITRRLFLSLGFFSWFIFALLRFPPSPESVDWVNLLFLLAPLLLIPIGLRLISRYFFSVSYSSFIIYLDALSLMVAYLLWPGPIAGFFAVPWLIVTLGMVLEFIGTLLPEFGWHRFRQLPVSFLCAGVTLLFLPIGAGWAVVDRFGWRPLGFDGMVIKLTATHFHYAGFLLPLITGISLRNFRPNPWIDWMGWGVIIGVPLVAIGITASHFFLPPIVETVAVLVMTVSGFGVACLHVYLGIIKSKKWWVNQMLWYAGALCLAAGMILAFLFGLRHYYPLDWLDMPWMYSVHGTLNTVGLAILVMGWSVRRSQLPKWTF